MASLRLVLCWTLMGVSLRVEGSGMCEEGLLLWRNLMRRVIFCSWQQSLREGRCLAFVQLLMDNNIGDYPYAVAYKFHMILQQNYIKIADYTQKALEIYCRRSLGIAIVRLLQKRKARERERHYNDQKPDQVMSGLCPRACSEKSLQLPIDESFDHDSMHSELRKTQNNIEKGDGGGKAGVAQQRFQINYRDLVYIHYFQAKVKSYLNKFKLCTRTKVSASQNFRCIFELVNPDDPSSVCPLRGNSRFCLKNVSKDRYLRVSEKVCSSTSFMRELKLSRDMDENCIFECSFNEDFDGMGIVSGETIFFRHFSQSLYLAIDSEMCELTLSFSSCPFVLKKVNASLKDVVPQYYRIESPKFQRYLEAVPVELESMCMKKVYTTVFALTENEEKIKMNPVTYSTFDLSKAPEEDIRMSLEAEKGILGCWEINRSANKYGQQVVQIMSPITGMGLVIKNRLALKLSPRIQELAQFKLTEHQNQVVSFSDQNSNELEVVYERQSERCTLTICKSEGPLGSRKLRLRPVPQKEMKMIVILSEILEALGEHVQFYEQWGHEIDEKSEILYYSVKKIKLSSTEMLKKIKEMNFINRKFKQILQDPTFSEQQICETANNIKIFHILIQISKVIAQKIGMGVRLDLQDINNPFSLARENLEEMLMFILGLILRLTKDNTINSSAIISEVTFFNRILIEYPEKIGEILQEAIKNLSIFTCKSSIAQCSELFLWVKLIEPLRQPTILIQKTYIDIIAEVVVDPQDEGIVPYQNRCKELLFIQKSSKKNGVPRFGVEAESGRPTIMLVSENLMEQFIKDNQLVSKLKVERLNSPHFFIEEFFCSNPYDPSRSIYDHYVLYIISVIKLFRNLCKGRNKKLIKVAADWGVTQEHILAVFESSRISWLLKSHYMSLWVAIFADQEPFLSFQKRESKCHNWHQISRYNILDFTALVFKQYTDENLVLLKLQDFKCKVLPIFCDFLHSFEARLPDALYDKSELECFLLAINSLHVLVTFGYLTVQEMKNFIGVIIRFLNTFDSNRSQYRRNEPEITKLHQKIITSFCKVLDLYEDIWVELYGMQFLQEFHSRFASKSFRSTHSEIQQWWESALDNKFDDSVPEQPKAANNRKKTRAHMSENYLSRSSDKVSIAHLNGNRTYSDVEDSIKCYLLGILAHRLIEQKEESYSMILNLLDKKMRRCQRISEYLKQNLILSCGREEEIYNNFSGREPGRLLNWLKIEELVIKFKEYEIGHISSDNEKYRKEKELELTNILLKVIREITLCRALSKQLLNKCQLVLVKLNVHTILLEMLSLAERPSHETTKTIYQFFYNLMKGNPTICSLLAVHLDKFTKVLNNQYIMDIIPTLVSSSPDKGSAFWVIRRLIPQLSFSQSECYLAESLTRIVCLNRGSAQVQHLRKKLSQYLLQKVTSPRILTESASFSSIKLVCEIASGCSELEQRLYQLYPKSELMNHLMRSACFEEKKVYLKLLIEVHMRKKKMENFEVEDYIEYIVAQEVRRLPHAMIKLLDRAPMEKEPLRDDHKARTKRKVRPQTRERLRCLYEEVALFEGTPVQTAEEEVYLDFFFNNSDPNEASVLVFAEIVLSKWTGSQKSSRLSLLKKHFAKVEELIRLIIAEVSKDHHRRMLERLERVNGALDDIVDGYDCPQMEETLTSEDKKEVIAFFKNLSNLLRKESIGFQTLLQCFNVDPELLQSKQQGSNVIEMVTYEGFMGLMRNLHPHVLHEAEFEEILDGIELFRFFNFSREGRSKKINIYWFMEKLVSIQQYQKNCVIKKMIEAEEDKELSPDPDPEFPDFSPLAVRNFTESTEQPERQFAAQVSLLCHIGQEKFSGSIESGMRRRLRKICEELKKNTIKQWQSSKVLNIFKASSKFPSSILLTIAEQAIVKMNPSTYQLAAKDIEDYFYTLTERVSGTNGAAILGLVANLIESNSSNYSFALLAEGFCLDSARLILKKCAEGKCSHNIQLLQAFKCLYKRMVCLPDAGCSWRVSMKTLLGTYIKDRAVTEFQTFCIYEVSVMGQVLEMWNCDDMPESTQYELLFKDRRVRRMILALLDKKLLEQITASNNKNLTQVRLTAAVLKTLIKYEENNSTCSIIGSKELADISEAAQHLYGALLPIKIESYEQEEYCFSLPTCSPYFCNNSRITLHEQSILHITLGLFILLRIGVAKASSCLGEQKYSTAIGHIFYLWRGRSRSFSFRLPSINRFLNEEIDSQIRDELQGIPRADIPLVLHPLSRVAGAKFDLLSSLSKVPPVKLMAMHTQVCKRIINVVLIAMMFYQFYFMQANSVILNTAVFTVLLLFNLFFLALEAHIFHHKCAHLFRVKYEIAARESPGLGSTPRKLAYFWLTQVVRSFIPMRILILLAYAFTLYKSHLVILTFSLQALDLQIIRNCFRDCFRFLKRFIFVFLAMAMFIDFALILVASLPEMSDQSIHTVWTKLINILRAVLLFWEMPNEGGLVSPLFGVLMVACSVAVLHMTVKIVINSKRSRQRARNRCSICLLSKEELKKQGQSLQSHIQNVHRLWDYLFFFMELDRKGDIEGLPLSVKQMVGQGDYCFLKQ